MRGFAAHAEKSCWWGLPWWCSCWRGDCALRSDAPLTPGELAGRAKSEGWESVTCSGEQPGLPEPPRGTAALVIAVERLEDTELLCPSGSLRYMVGVDLQ